MFNRCAVAIAYGEKDDWGASFLKNWIDVQSMKLVSYTCLICFR